MLARPRGIDAETITTPVPRTTAPVCLETILGAVAPRRHQVSVCRKESDQDMNCSSTPRELGLYFRPFRGRSAGKVTRARKGKVSGHCGKSSPNVYRGCCCG